MKIIVCLGNPGKKYLKNRHNIGFIIGDYLISRFSFKIKKKDSLFWLGEGEVESKKTFLLFPQTYMNSSGKAVQKALHFYQEKPEDLIVIHDEIELPFGQIKIKNGGGHKGHNGLRSIMKEVGSANFHRFRFGVGRPENDRIPVADYVLSNFMAEEIAEIKKLLPSIEKEVRSLII